jgi:phage tail sheath protein FI
LEKYLQKENREKTMSDYKTPGVYVEEKTVLASSVAGVSTAVPAFIGYTRTAGVNNSLYYQPTKVKNLTEYVSYFGTAPDTEITVTISDDTIVGVEIPDTVNNMYYSMQMFFNNGGESCYIVALNAADTTTEAQRYAAALDALKLEDEPTLIILVDGVNMASVNYYTVCQQVLAQCQTMKDRFAIFDVIDSGTGTVDADALAFRNGIGDNYLNYGAAYYPYLRTTLNYQFSDTSVKVVEGENIVTLGSLYTLKNALYNNIINQIKSYYLTLPPSAAVAGLYASVDRDRGVWKAPANVSFASVSGPSRKLTQLENDGLNVEAEKGKSINAIRGFSGRGTLIWGARTLAGNDNEWRYVSVRRLFNYIEESIQKSTAYAVFEPNTAMTWLKLRSMVESFLENLWRQGALAGSTAEDAFFVQVGLGTTMTSDDILNGKLIIKVGVAAMRPAEFIILEFTHKTQ